MKSLKIYFKLFLYIIIFLTHNNNGWCNLRRRSFDYYYKSCDLEMKNPLDKKRYEYLNEFGYNIDSNKRRIIDFDMQIKRHKNSDSK